MAAGPSTGTSHETGMQTHTKAVLLHGDVTSALFKGQSQEVAILKGDKSGGLILWRRVTCLVNCCF